MQVVSSQPLRNHQVISFLGDTAPTESLINDKVGLDKSNYRLHFDDDPPRLQLNENGVAKSAQFPPYLDVNRTLEANLCFFIQLSASSMVMAPRLIERLWHPRNIILLHIDAKVPYNTVAQFKAILSKKAIRYHNVHMLEREPITYAGISMALNTLGAMEFALNLAQPWDYFINLSGADYPLISVRNMRILYGQPRVLRQGVSFIQLSYGEPFWTYLKRHRYDVAHIDPALGLPPNSNEQTSMIKLWGRTRGAAPLKVYFVHGEAWITAHRKLVLASTRGAYARRLLPLLANTLSAAEHFFPMLAWNTHLNRTTAHYAGRSIFWEHKGKMSGQHPYAVDGEGDLYAFWDRMAGGPGIFARKFSRPDSPLLDRIDSQLAGIAPHSNATSAAKKFRTVLVRNMCSADIERQWNQAARHDYSRCLHLE